MAEGNISTNQPSDNLTQICQDATGEDWEDGGGDGGGVAAGAVDGGKVPRPPLIAQQLLPQAYMDCYELSQVQGEKEIAQIFARR